jgi:hypothetical protein
MKIYRGADKSLARPGVASTKETTLIGRISDVRPERGTDFVAQKE